MRITILVLMVLCINLSLALVSSFGLFNNSAVAYDKQLINDLNDTVANQDYLGTNVQTTTTTTGFGDFITGLYTFIKVFFEGVFLPFRMMENFGIDSAIAIYMSFPVYLVYMVAIIQFISGRFLE